MIDRRNAISKKITSMSEFAEETIPRLIAQNLKAWTGIFFANSKWNSKLHKKLLSDSFSEYETCITIDPFKDDPDMSWGRNPENQSN